MLAIGDVVADKYRIDRVIGQGGMGVVAVATHVQLGQRVAIKVLRDEFAGDAGFVTRLFREARATATLHGDHVCRVTDVGQLPGGAPYLVMELLEGSDLAAVVARRALPIATAADYVLQACVALAEAHAAGIIHRDLKPGNLFLTKRLDGSPLIKVLDFGIAKAPGGDLALTRTAAVLGSPRYMSPEQLRSARDVDARTDIWALGVILYELVSQRVPFPADSITELAVKVAVDAPQPLDIEPAFRNVVWRCLEKPVERRYQDVVSFAADLARFASPVGASTAQVVSGIGRARPDLPRAAAVDPIAPTAADTTLGSGAAEVPAPAPRRRAWLATIGVLGIVGGGAAIAMWPKHEAAQLPPDARAIDARLPDAAIDVAAPPPDAAPPADAPPDIPAQLRAAYKAKQWDKVIASAHQLSRRGELTQDLDALYAQASQTILDDAQPAIDEKLALRECAAARAIAKKAFARADKWDTLIDTRIKECEVAYPSVSEHDIAHAIDDRDYAKAIKLGKTLLVRDPNDQGVLELTGMAACYAKNEALGQKYLNQLTNSETRENRLSLCHGIVTADQ